MKIKQHRAEAGYHENIHESPLNEGQIYLSYSHNKTRVCMQVFVTLLALYLVIHINGHRTKQRLFDNKSSQTQSHLQVTIIVAFFLSFFVLVCVGMEMWEQMMRDAELARRLQDEEDSQPRRRVCSTHREISHNTSQIFKHVSHEIQDQPGG